MALRTSFVLRATWLACALSVGCQAAAPARVSSGKKMEAFPHSGIGPVLLGTQRNQLPAEAVVSKDHGRLEQIDFRLQGDVIQEVWIEDLRKFPHDLSFKGQPVDPLASGASLRAMFGVCTRFAIDAQHVRFICESGFVISLSPDESGRQVQLGISR